MSLSRATLLCGMLFYVFGDEMQPKTLPSSCLGLEDGYQQIQPLSLLEYQSLKAEQTDYLYEDSTLDAPVIAVLCKDGYTIINPASEENWKSYFSTVHQYAAQYMNPDLNDLVNWQEWFLPTKYDDDSLFTTSEDCQSCDDMSDSGFPDQTAYYTTSDNVHCAYPFKCSEDKRTQTCYTCESEVATNSQAVDNNAPSVFYGTCGHVEMYAKREIEVDHFTCNNAPYFEGLVFKPSLSVTGKYCVCYKPSSESTNKAYYDSTVDKTTADEEKQNKIEKASATTDVYVELKQSDFKYGTYRIMEPGLYRLMEDIEFDFNAGDLNNPNEAGSWMPHCDQKDDYPGACSWDGWYWLGFWAGITIEHDDVTLDLNGYSVGMSQAFYLQQRWFACISLSNKAFLDGAGPTFMGIGHLTADNVVIKNGKIGLTSHIGIYGGGARNFNLYDVHIHSFETHGILLNLFKNIVIERVEIGPSVNGQLKLNGNYNLARMLLPTFRAAATEALMYADNMTKTITFSNPIRKDAGVEYTLDDLTDKLVHQMDYAFKWAMGLINEDDIDTPEEQDIFQQAIDLYGNDGGLPRSGVLFGIVLRPMGAGVFNWGNDFSDRSQDYSRTALIKDVLIHDLVLEVDEQITISGQRVTIGGPLALEHAVQNKLEDLEAATYVGNVNTDILFALTKITKNWWYLADTLISVESIEWAESGLPVKVTTSSVPYTVCGMDSGGHTAKGIAGIKIERSYDVQFENIKIKNLQNLSPLASKKCGEWVNGILDDTVSTKFGWGSGNLEETRDDGYLGSHVRAISSYSVKDITYNNVEISNIMSYYGPVFGFYLHYNDDDQNAAKQAWTSVLDPLPSKITLKNIDIKHLDSGVMGRVTNVEPLDNPVNPDWPAESCAISCEDDDDCSMSILNTNNIALNNINGYTSCTLCDDTITPGSCYSNVNVNDDDGNEILYRSYKGDVIVSGNTITFKKGDTSVFKSVDVKQVSKTNTESKINKNNNKNNNSKLKLSIKYIIAGLLVLVLMVGLCIPKLRNCCSKKEITGNKSETSAFLSGKHYQYNSFY